MANIGQALFTPDTPRWHALCVRPGHEIPAQRFLAQAGIYSFFPVRMRHSPKRGKYASRYLPGYLFAKFPGPPRLHVLLETPWVRDVVRAYDDHPAILRPQDLELIHRMRERDEEQDRRIADARKIKVGARVRLMEGVAQGEHVVVARIKGGKVHFSLPMFGSEVQAEARIGSVEVA